MSIPKAGFAFEDRLIAYLNSQQYEVVRDRTLDHDYKLDFVIRRFPNNPKFHSMGVQVTTMTGNMQKLQEFAQVHTSEYKVVEKAVYLEVEGALDFEKGVGHLISAALSDFQFNSARLGEALAGIKINRDMTYTLYDVASMLASLAQTEMRSRAVATPSANGSAPAPARQVTQVVKAVPDEVADLPEAARGIKSALQDNTKPIERPKLQGFINAYYRTKDHGFITSQIGDSYYFTLNSVADGQLRDRLLALPSIDWGASVDGTVEFEDIGKTRPLAKYPEARMLRLAR